MKKLLWLTVLGGFGLAGAQGSGGGQVCAGEAGPPAWVQSGIYTGSVGPFPVTLRLAPGQADQNAYFYHSKGVNLPLKLLHQGNQLVLQEEGWDFRAGRQVVTGCFVLTQRTDTLTGTWKGPAEGRKPALRVSLKPLNVAAQPLRLPSSPGLLKLRQQDPLSFLKFNRPWQNVAGGIKEPHSGIVYPRVAGATPALRAVLQDQQLEYAQQAMECGAGQIRREDLSVAVETKVTMQTPRLLSLTGEGGGDCGGAHPFLIFSAQTLDKQTGQPFVPTQLWPALNSDALLAAYLKGFPAAQIDCKTAALSNESDLLQTVLTPAGLTIYNDNYPEVARECRSVGVTLPYAQLKGQANPKSPYYRDIYR